MLNVWMSDGNSSTLYKLFSPDNQPLAGAWLRVVQVGSVNVHSKQGGGMQGLESWALAVGRKCECSYKKGGGMQG